MLTLAIETSNPPARAVGSTDGARGGSSAAGVALGIVGEQAMGASAGEASQGLVRVLGVEPLHVEAALNDDLMPAIDRLCGRLGVTPGRIGRVAVSIGPGGFTSLRIAAATAKCIALATGARCIAVPTAEALIRRVDARLRADRPTVIALAWKREDAWAVRFEAGRSFDPSEAGGLRRLESLASDGRALLVADATLEAMLRSRGLIGPEVIVCPPMFDPVAVLEASAGRSATDAAGLTPLYPREPEAVKKWRELHPRA